MADLRTAAQQALETLEQLQGGCTDSDDGTVEAITVWCPEVIDALRAALAQQEQEPVGEVSQIDSDCDGQESAWIDLHHRVELGQPLFTHPPRREWRSLSEEEIDRWTPEIHPVIRAIEQALKERNT